MSLFFTSDTHFGHANILQYCGRPFEDVNKMDEALIERWNTEIKDNDVVYHLGDFTFGDYETFKKYILQLNGKIRLLSNPWHHDRRWLKDFKVWDFRGRVQLLGQMDVLKLNTKPMEDNGKQTLVLSHYPLAVWDRKHYGAWHLHGHSHGTFLGSGYILDVGVDGHGYVPWSISEIEEKMKTVSFVLQGRK